MVTHFSVSSYSSKYFPVGAPLSKIFPISFVFYFFFLHPTLSYFIFTPVEGECLDWCEMLVYSDRGLRSYYNRMSPSVIPSSRNKIPLLRPQSALMAFFF